MNFRMSVVAGLIAGASAVLLSIAPAAAQVADGPGHGPVTDRGCRCTANDASCLFGEAGGCNVSCPPGFACECEGASCPFGFPSSATCSCVHVGV